MKMKKFWARGGARVPRAPLRSATVYFIATEGADPELLLGGGANPWGEGRLPNILIIFSKKPYEIKGILVRMGGGARRGRPP